MIVTVAGMRDWKNKQQVFDELTQLLEEHCETWRLEHDVSEPQYQPNPGSWMKEMHEAFVVRHGASGNVDNWADEWARERGVTIERFEAEWHGPSGKGPLDYSAGPVRNRKMAQAKPRAHLWLSFWNGKFRQRGQRKVSGSFDGIVAALESGLDVKIKPPRP